MHTNVDPADLSSPKYGGFVSSFHESAEDKGTFSFDKEAGAGPGHQVKVAVPEWLEKVLRGGVSIGPGGSATVNANSGSVGGSLNAGPCSNVFNGGSNNQGTTNCELTPSWKLDQKHLDTLTSAFKANLPPGCVVSVATDGDSKDLATQLCGAGRTSNEAMLCAGPGFGNISTPFLNSTNNAGVVGLGCYADDPKNPSLLAVQKSLAAVGLECEYKGTVFKVGQLSICTGGSSTTVVVGNMPAKSR